MTTSALPVLCRRRGGVNRSNARRAAKTLAMTSRQVKADELPDIVRACILCIVSGQMEPSVASAVATLARTSLQLSHDLEVEPAHRRSGASSRCHAGERAKDRVNDDSDQRAEDSVSQTSWDSTVSMMRVCGLPTNAGDACDEPQISR